MLQSQSALKTLKRSVHGTFFRLNIQGLRGSLFDYCISEICAEQKDALVVVLPIEQEVESLAQSLSELGLRAQVYPAVTTAPYQSSDTPHAMQSPAEGRRIRVLQGLMEGSIDVLCISLRSMLTYIPPPQYLSAKQITLSAGQSIVTESLLNALIDLSYTRVKRVSVPSEFALRGEVCDIFIPGDEYPTRIVFEWDSIEKIRSFDPITQTTTEDRSAVTILPCREILWSSILKSTREDGLNSHAPATVLNYIAGDYTLCIGEYERCITLESGFAKEYNAIYRKLYHSESIPQPKKLIANIEKLEADSPRIIRFRLFSSDKTATGQESDMNASKTAQKTEAGAKKTEASEPSEENQNAESAEAEIHFRSEASRSFFGNINFFREEVSNLIGAGYSIYLSVDSEPQKQRLEHLFQDIDLRILQGHVSQGFSLPSAKFMLIQEQEIFGRKRRVPQSIKRVQSRVIDSFVELDEGDYIVHLNHGIGKFLGIQRMTMGARERDYIRLEFANEEFVFVPIEQVNLVQRYIGGQGNAPALDTVGGKSWRRRRAQVSRRVEEIAEELIKLYSTRKLVAGYSFPSDSEWQIEFEASFPFEETEDQLLCIDDVKSDMESNSPMDRLICGDVGYGKTEIAMRAAFKAVSAGRQVAFLTPTTILSEQHFETAKERMERFPIEIKMLSRLVPRSEQKKTIAQIADGQVDLVIGTHRIIQKDMRFKNLGLIIVDEEQRFGVRDKERLKELKASVDCLTLSATPIPRTLHMSLLKIRDISLLKTPPQNRRPIETHVEAMNNETITRAVRREVQRGGQVFYLHNRIETLDHVQRTLQNLMPEITVGQAHGQMNPYHLEEVMHRFIHGGFQVLIATTIIENGIDIPNVNTIIIDRADMYGISQLYQLRGRVGRSGRLAYAYLLYPDQRALSELAMKRLQIINDNSELGSGFKIAMKDLEIRGAGNLLGSEQSGDIHSVGFDLYIKLLNDAIRRRTEADDSAGSEVYLEIEYSGFIPDSYISDTMEKMEVYKRIASVGTQEELDSVYGEIADHYGPLPDEVFSLLALAEIRILCYRLGISELRERAGTAEVHFRKIARLNIDKVMEVIRTSGGAVRPSSANPHVLLVDTSLVELSEKSEYLRERLASIVGG